MISHQGRVLPDQSVAEHDELSAGGPARSRLTGSLADRIEVLVPLLGYVITVLCSITTSSLGVASLRQNPAHPLGTVFGGPQPLRSDEWLTQTPIELNVLALGHSSHSPLAQAPDIVFQLSSGQFFESIFFFDTTLLRLGRWLPDAQLFAAMRALPILLVLLTLPPLLRRFGASRPQSWLAVALTVLAPTTLWWSFTPVRILAFASFGSFLLVCARQRWAASARWHDKATPVLQAALGGIVLARLATYYIPWCLTVGVPLVVATAAWLVWSSPRRPGLVVLGIGTGVGALLLGLTMWENLDALRATFGTVYPGSRRSSGEALAPFKLFGAPGLFKSADAVESAIPNASEIASAFLVCAVWAGLLWSWMRPHVPTRERAALWGLTATLMVWVAWCTMPWGALGEHLPILNFVPAARAAQTVGYAGALVLCLVLSRLDRPSLWRGIPAAAACGLVTAYGVGDLQTVLPPLSAADVWLTALGVALLVWLVTSFPRSWAPVALVTVALMWSGYRVNPINFGLGDLRASAAAGIARQMGEQARKDGGWIAADSPYVSALFVANGAPSLTGYQVSGPVTSAWKRLDPSGAYRTEWNRGASFLRMDFSGPADQPATVSNPNFDVIEVSIDPCVLAASGLHVEYIVSSTVLTSKCAHPVRKLRWSGQTQRVYALEQTTTGQ